MKKNILILLVALSMEAIAQQTSPPSPSTNPQKKEKIEAMKIAFLTEKMDLTPEEAQRFWPVYNSFEKKRGELHKNRRTELKNIDKNLDSITDRQAETIVDGEMEFKQQNLDLEKEYHSKFKAVLPIKKVAKLYRAENMFARHLLKQISEHGKNNRPDHRNNGDGYHARPNPDMEK